MGQGKKYLNYIQVCQHLRISDLNKEVTIDIWSKTKLWPLAFL